MLKGKEYPTNPDQFTSQDIAEILSTEIRRLENVRPTLAGEAGVRAIEERHQKANTLRRCLKFIGIPDET